MIPVFAGAFHDSITRKVQTDNHQALNGLDTKLPRSVKILIAL